MEGGPDARGKHLTDRTEANVFAARLYYRALTGPLGWPNGMPHWHEMTPDERYSHAAVALSFLDSLVREGMIETKAPLGLDGVYGEGDCAALLERLRSAVTETTVPPPA